MLKVSLRAVREPYKALDYAICSTGELHNYSGKIMTASQCGFSSNGNFRNDGTVYASVEAMTRSGSGVCTGTVTIPSDVKAMPGRDVIDYYASLATPIPSSSTMERFVLSPGRNPFGATNANGVYVITTTSDITLRAFRLQGTLVIRAPGKKVKIDSAALLESARSDYPTLLVDGDLEIKTSGRTLVLSEFSWLTSFNPPGAPYAGQADSDFLDTYPNEIRGLIHVLGNVRITSSAVIKGCMIVEGEVDCESYPDLQYSGWLYDSPPVGYSQATGMEVVANSWNQEVE